MTSYLDASAILPTLVLEASTDAVGLFLRNLSTPPALSSFAAGEVSASLARLVRMAMLTEDDAKQRLADFDQWRAAATEAIEIEPADIRLAALLVRQFELKLRMPDAVHAAACRRRGWTLVTLDKRLAAAAERLDIGVLFPA